MPPEPAQTTGEGPTTLTAAEGRLAGEEPSKGAAAEGGMPAASDGKAGAEEKSKKSDGSWLRRALGLRTRDDEQPDSEADEDSSDGADTSTAKERKAEPPKPQAQSNGQQAQKQATWRPPSNPEEEARRIQAEVDRRAALTKKKELRQSDPYAYVQAEEAEEDREQRTRAFQSFVGGIVKQYDTVTLDPIVKELGKEAQPIIDGAAEGLDGRKHIIESGLKALKKKWTAEGYAAAEKKLGGDPVFRKRALRSEREEDEEPDNVPSAVSSARSGDMNQWMRAALGRYSNRRTQTK